MRDYNVFDLSGKKAVVTGASRGIGKEIAISLARHGADVVLVSRDMGKMLDLEEKIRKFGVGVKSCVVDVSIPEQINRFLETELQSFGGVDLFINNAAITIFKTFMQSTIEDFDKLVATNVRGAFTFVQGAARKMIEQGRGGSIVFVTSINAISALPSQAIYSATKSMLESLMKSSASELASYGIRVNSVVPGAINTDMNPHFTEESMKELGKRIPIGRVGEADDIGDVVAFLCSDAARYMSGSSIVVDGGFLLRR